jgi:predicted alpha/beta hydrolase family esterase
MTRGRSAVVLPGIHGSDEHHWQSLWESNDPSLARFTPTSWDRPNLRDWEVALTVAVTRCPEPPVVIAHSLATLLVAHWARTDWARRAPIAGAFLVSVPNPDSRDFPPEAVSFRDVPRTLLPFPALVITSSNDPYGDTSYQAKVASDWRAGWLCVGDFGHLNSSAGVGSWAVGRQLYTAFVAGLPRHGR